MNINDSGDGFSNKFAQETFQEKIFRILSFWDNQIHWSHWQKVVGRFSANLEHVADDFGILNEINLWANQNKLYLVEIKLLDKF